MALAAPVRPDPGRSVRRRRTDTKQRPGAPAHLSPQGVNQRRPAEPPSDDRFTNRQPGGEPALG